MPNWRSIWVSAAASAFFLSSFMTLRSLIIVVRRLFCSVQKIGRRTRLSLRNPLFHTRPDASDPPGRNGQWPRRVIDRTRLRRKAFAEFKTVDFPFDRIGDLALPRRKGLPRNRYVGIPTPLTCCQAHPGAYGFSMSGEIGQEVGRFKRPQPGNRRTVEITGSLQSQTAADQFVSAQLLFERVYNRVRLLTQECQRQVNLISDEAACRRRQSPPPDRRYARPWTPAESRPGIFAGRPVSQPPAYIYPMRSNRPSSAACTDAWRTLSRSPSKRKQCESGLPSGPAQPIQTVPTGLLRLPPSGPAIPLMASAQ